MNHQVLPTYEIISVGSPRLMLLDGKHHDFFSEKAVFFFFLCVHMNLGGESTNKHEDSTDTYAKKSLICWVDQRMCCILNNQPPIWTVVEMFLISGKLL